MAKERVLAIDQGTTSSRAIAFDERGTVVAAASQEFAQHFPRDGWVEHDPEDIWNSTVHVCRQVIDEVTAQGGTIAAIGITNQRETTLVWDRESSKCIYNAIVWQDRRTADICNRMKSEGLEESFRAKTGLLLDPYFSGTKLAWMLEHVDGARALAERGQLAFGTVDAFLLWRLTGGKAHLTDATNASRTLMLDIHLCEWDSELLNRLSVPAGMLPEVRDCSGAFGVTEPELFGTEIPVYAMIGDQQAALIGQACLEPGMAKSTFGTGCFVVANVGTQALESHHRLLTTIGYRLHGTTTYAIEGSIFNAGSAVQWLRDRLKFIDAATDSEKIARGLDGNHGVYLVPAFTGLGAPYWDADARGGIFGLTRDTGPEEIVRATLESVAYQTRDLLDTAKHDGAPLTALRVDGGMSRNSWLMQFLADVTGIEVHRAATTEATAWGAAALAGVEAGLIPSIESMAANWSCERIFVPSITGADRAALLSGWDDAVQRIQSS